MASISMSDIYCNGTIFENDDEQLIYLTPSFPQRYTSNTWIYKKTPTQERWLKDLERQHNYIQIKVQIIMRLVSRKMNNLIIIGWLCLKI